MDKKKKLVLQIIAFIGVIITLTIVYNYIINSYTKEQINQSEKEENKMNITEIMAKDFQQEVINSEKTVLVDFYATWCGPCKMMSPILENIAEENTHVKVVKVDIDKNQDLAMQYNVMSIPTMIIFKNGEATKTFVGVTDKHNLSDAL